MAKKALMLTVAAFAIFFLLSQPVSAADSVKLATGAVGDAFTQVARFFGALIG
jgi:NADPH-dependent curcumin reductase CurA